MNVRSSGVPTREVTEPRVVASGLAFPEGPVIMDDGSVIVVEMLAGLVTRCHPDGRRSQVADVGGGPNGAAFGPDGHLYVCNNGGRRPGHLCRPGIQRIDVTSGAVDEVYVECDGVAFASPNDLVFDAAGNFWFTDLQGHALFYATPDGASVSRAVAGADGPNGVGLSPDGSVLYWAQTHTRQVMRRALSGPGQVVDSPGYSIRALVTHGRVDPSALVVGLPGGAELDSLAVEEGGALCVGTLVESGITVVDPSGTVVEKVVLPANLADGAVTNICFGGPDRRTAFLTLSLTGRLLACRWPRPGLRLAFES